MPEIKKQELGEAEAAIEAENRKLHRDRAPETHMGVLLSLWLKIILHTCKVKANKDGPEQLSREELLAGSYKTNSFQRSLRTDNHLSSLQQEWRDLAEHVD